MPFFSHAMAETIQPMSQKNMHSQHTIRSMPGNAPNGATVVYCEAQPATKERYRYGVTQRKLMFTRSLIQAQVEQTRNSAGPWSVEQYSKLFHSYTIDRKNRLMEADSSPESGSLQIYGARSVAYPDMPLLVRIYTRAELKQDSELFLKILRHLGRKHPNIVTTMDLFQDQSSVYVFQELVVLGNLMQYLEHQSTTTDSQQPGQTGGPPNEPQLQQWAKQLFRALDFLGDQAIAHRRITPNHILVKRTGFQLTIKLTGFMHSILYWDTATNDVVYCPCWPASRQHTDGPNFQAPEVYGDPAAGEHFDPILADTWSYGANVYYMAAKQYPYNMMGDCADIDAETTANIARLPLSDDGRKFVSQLLRANANDRMSFEFINRDVWLHPKLKNKPVIETPYKYLKKVKLQSKSAPKTGDSHVVKSVPVSHSVAPSSPHSSAPSSPHTSASALPHSLAAPAPHPSAPSSPHYLVHSAAFALPNSTVPPSPHPSSAPLPHPSAPPSSPHSGHTSGLPPAPIKYLKKVKVQSKLKLKSASASNFAKSAPGSSLAHSSAPSSPHSSALGSSHSSASISPHSLAPTSPHSSASISPHSSTSTSAHSAAQSIAQSSHSPSISGVNSAHHTSSASIASTSSANHLTAPASVSMAQVSTSPSTSASSASLSSSPASSAAASTSAHNSGSSSTSHFGGSSISPDSSSPSSAH